MPIILPSKSIYYKDVNLIARQQNLIESRSEVTIDRSRIIVAPMDAVVNTKFALEALDLGLSVCLHRFNEVDEAIKQAQAIRREVGNQVFKRVTMSIGLNDAKRIEAIHKAFYTEPRILVDVANGYLRGTVTLTNHLNALGFRTMTGNVQTAAGFMQFPATSMVRLGIGNGRACQTSDITGYNRGQITEILDCYNVRLGSDAGGPIIIADGGIKGPGELAKAFGAGADYAMMGGYFACAESAENVVSGEYSYWGGASTKQQVRNKNANLKHSEGKEILLNQNDVVPLKKLVDDLFGGLSSAISYSGYADLDSFIGNGQFELKQSS